MKTKPPKKADRRIREETDDLVFDGRMREARPVRVFVNRRRTKIVLEQPRARRAPRVVFRPEQIEHVCAMLSQAAEQVEAAG